MRLLVLKRSRIFLGKASAASEGHFCIAVPHREGSDRLAYSQSLHALAQRLSMPDTSMPGTKGDHSNPGAGSTGIFSPLISSKRSQHPVLSGLQDGQLPTR